MSEEFYTIQKTDVDRSVINAFDRHWYVPAFMRRVLRKDVGKRASLCRNEAEDYLYLQVESDEQFLARTAHKERKHQG